MGISLNWAACLRLPPLLIHGLRVGFAFGCGLLCKSPGNKQDRQSHEQDQDVNGGYPENRSIQA